MEDFQSLKVNETDSFEDGLNKLEKVTKLLENEQLPLEDSLSLYEISISLYKFCTNKIENANQRIKILSEGNFVDFQS